MMIEIYVYSSGGYFHQLLNGIAAFCNSDTFKTMIRWGLMVSVIVSLVLYIRTRNLKVFFNYFMAAIAVVSVMVSIKQDVQVIDASDRAKVYKVDNVPLGVSAPAHFISSLGYALAYGYETIVAQQPDVLQYTQSGLMFGARLANQSTQFELVNSRLKNQLNDYTVSCTFPDIMLNDKFSFEQLKNSEEPFELIFSKPSPLRGLYIDGEFKTCKEASLILQKDMKAETKADGKTFTKYVNEMMPGRTNAAGSYSTALETTYDELYNAGKTAQDIMLNNITMSAIRDGVSSHAMRNNATASMINISTEMAAQRQLIQNATGGQMAARFLPSMHTVMFAVLLAIFPFLVMVSLVNGLTWRVWKMYFMAMFSLQLWPVFFSIFNGFIHFHLKGDLTMVTLSNINEIQRQNSQAASIAGWLMTSIPVIAWAMMSGIGGLMSSAASSFASSDTGAAAQSSGRVAEGNYALNNMQMNNISANKHDTNSLEAHGKRTVQNANGSYDSTNPDGSTTFDSSGAMSKLPMSMRFSDALSATASRAASSSLQETQSHAQGMRRADDVSIGQLKSFGRTLSEGVRTGDMVQTSQSAGVQQGLSDMKSATLAYAKLHGISETEAENQLKERSREIYAGAQGSAGVNFFGTGAGVNAGARTSGSDRDSLSTGTNQINDSNKREDAALVEQFSQGYTLAASSVKTMSGTKEGADINNELQQVQTAVNHREEAYSDFSQSTARTEALQSVATRARTQSAQVDAEHSQLFVNWLQESKGMTPAQVSQLVNNPGDAKAMQEVRALSEEYVKFAVRNELNPPMPDAPAMPAAPDSREVQRAGDSPQQRAGNYGDGVNTSPLTAGVVAAGGTAALSNSERSRVDGEYESQRGAIQGEENKYQSKWDEIDKNSQQSFGNVSGRINAGDNLIDEQSQELKRNHDDNIHKANKTIDEAGNEAGVKGALNDADKIAGDIAKKASYYPDYKK